VKQFFRILLIEDDNERVETFKAWLPDDVRLVHAGSAGRAIGILQRDRNAYAGIMLDHDLRGQMVTEKDFSLDGIIVSKTIMANIPSVTPILIHSMNPADAPKMVLALSKSGFSVTRIPMSAITEEKFCEWLEEAREMWAERS
jgi:CheY-like chemotaxis protein